MKKITILTSHLTHGGVEKCISNVSNMLCKDYEIEIVSLYKLKENPAYEFCDKIKIKYLINNDLPLKLNGYKTLLFKLNFKNLMKELYQDYFKKLKFISFFKDAISGIYLMSVKRKKELKKYLKNCNSDYIISTHMFMYKLVDKFGKGKKIGWEHNHHHNNKKYINKIINYSKYIDKLIVVNKSLKEYYLDLNIDTEVVFIPNFVKLTPSKVSNLNNKNLLSVGRLSPEKGMLDLIDVMKKLVKLNKSIKLDIVGDGIEYHAVKNKIIEYNLQDNIIMHGYIDGEKLDKLRRETSLYLMTSYTESFGLVLIEAMRYKIPCIAFDSAEGANDLIKNGYNGYLIPNRNVDQMAKKVSDLLNSNLDRLGNNAKMYSENFNESNNYEFWKKTLESNNNNIE